MKGHVMTEIALLTALGIATAFASLLVIADVITNKTRRTKHGHNE